jgi:lysyl-tRNA synthetase class 2
MLEKIEPALATKDEPVILWHFPPSQAALSRLTPEGWADRFELYWRGLEIANAFHELNDPHENRRRFQEDQNRKTARGKSAPPIDEELMTALHWGMPPASGIALGMERLFMALLKLNRIEDVRLFPMRT